MLYLYLLYEHGSSPPLLRRFSFGGFSSPPGIGEMAIAYRQNFNVDQLQFLGEQPVERLPSSADAFVVSTSLLVLQKSGISFDSQQDEISYSLDRLGDRMIGTCRIHIRSPQPVHGSRPAPPRGEARVVLRDAGKNRRGVITALYKLRDAYDVAKMDASSYGALLDNTPSMLFDGVDRQWAEVIKRQLESSGAAVEVEQTRPKAD